MLFEVCGSVEHCLWDWAFAALPGLIRAARRPGAIGHLAELVDHHVLTDAEAQPGRTQWRRSPLSAGTKCELSRRRVGKGCRWPAVVERLDLRLRRPADRAD